MVTDMKYLHFAFALRQVIDHAENSKEWVVIICPNPKSVLACARQIASALPTDARFSGRTAMFSSGGHVSVVSAQEDIFPPLDTKPFTTAFVGWDTSDPGASRWNDQAAKTFKFAV